MYESYRYHAEHVAATPELYDPRTLTRILRGREVSTEQYEAARARTMQLRAETARLFEHVDAIVTPTVPIPPPSIAELESDPDKLRARELIMLRNTRPFNVLGLPTVTVPCGITLSGMPVGLQITTASNRDMLALTIARHLLGD
jgi:Asp-tRNA(Asn)/Glu-tRNA(Gln) amidotransferase A subunit family amidase